jgi:hypothetical protein
MNAFRFSLAKPLVWLGCLLVIGMAGETKVFAASSTLEVRLVWGTNDDSSSDPKHKPLEAPLAKKLGMFKWKNYFTVNRQKLPLSGDVAKKIRLSKRCEIKVQHLDGSRYEINVFGQGKHVRKIIEKITKEDSLVIAGDDKNDCGWFILIREI